MGGHAGGSAAVSRFSGRPAGVQSSVSAPAGHFSGAAVHSSRGVLQPSDSMRFHSRSYGTGHQGNWGTSGAYVAPPASLSGGTGTRTLGRHSQAFSANREFNRSNNYGGHWYPAHTHTNWDRGRAHYWHGHHYRWYNGGWLIFDGGFWPYDYGYPYYGYDNYPGTVYQPSYVSDYYDATAVATDVQSALADMGYYRGPIDGIIGPMTRQAIEDYQRDRGLVVSGRINRALLESLGLR